MKLFDLDSKLSFNDVLDNLALYYVIRNEYTSLSLKNKPAVEAVSPPDCNYFDLAINFQASI